MLYGGESQPDASLVLEHDATRVVLDARRGALARLHGEGREDGGQPRRHRQLGEPRTYVIHIYYFNLLHSYHDRFLCYRVFVFVFHFCTSHFNHKV